ncbi:hypothetical protein [Pseudoalteromonas luteoviolacea]|nr:hypothetical protein [Pseudoalteromonas luteoviolacea]
MIRSPEIDLNNSNNAVGGEELIMPAYTWCCGAWDLPSVEVVSRIKLGRN